jgi:hypothetical protein
MAKTKRALVRKMSDLLSTRKGIETTFRNFAVALEKNGHKEVGSIFRGLIESDIVDKILDDSAMVLTKKFTYEELEEICAFHESPVGTKYRMLAPEVLEEMTQIAEGYIDKELKRIMERGK